jgi:signal transduction histidine kinase
MSMIARNARQHPQPHQHDELDALVVTDSDGKVLEANPPALELLARHFQSSESLSFSSWLDEENSWLIKELTSLLAFDPGASIQLVRLPSSQGAGEDVLLGVGRLLSEQDDRGLLRWSLQEVHHPGDGSTIERATWPRFLANASLAFSRSLFLDETVTEVVNRAVPFIADWCTVDLLGGGDHYLRRVAVASLDSRQSLSVGSLRERYPITADGEHPVVAVITTGEPVLITEFTDERLRRMTRDEEHFTFIKGLGLRSSMILPLRANGRLIGAITFASAESQRRYDKADVDRYSEYAEHAAQAISNALERERSEQVSKARAQYLSVASHELRTPLAVVGGFSNLLLKELATDTPKPERVQLLIQELQHGIERLDTLTEDLLTASSLQQADQTIDVEEVDLTDLIDHIIQSFMVATSTAGEVRLVHQGDAGIRGFWDASLLRRALSNLVSNALKYAPEGSEVTITTQRQGKKHVRINVRDKGIGISDEDLEHLFQPFVRGSAARRMSEGTGLGLHITQQIVEQHRGIIDVDSTVGEGSTFTVVLPVKVE